MIVSATEGRLARTWYYQNEVSKRQHVITLFHDTITGLRSAMLDFVEMPNSFGNSSLLMDSMGHRLFFTISDATSDVSVPGYIEIKREGWSSFVYRCFIRDLEIKESTQILSDTSNIFTCSVADTLVTVDEEVDGSKIVWYQVKTKRSKDNITTDVHRRFKDFADMFSQVKQNFKGHHLRSSLPVLPEKTLKIATDYLDPGFINDRRMRLNRFLCHLVAVPHVAEMTCVKAFLGLMEQVREFSIAFDVPTLGISLITPERESPDNPALVGLIQKPDLCPGLHSGDAITKINGTAVAGSTFNGVVSRIKSLPRPIIIHFVQVISSQKGLNGASDKILIANNTEREVDDITVEFLDEASPNTQSVSKES